MPRLRSASVKRRVAPAVQPKPEKPLVQRQVSNRWTARIAEKGWTPVSDYFLANYHRLKITHTEATVIIHLMSFKWDSNAPFPALKTIARRMGITNSSLRTHLRSLEKKGVLQREMQIGTTNRFHLGGLFEKLERLIETDDKEPAAQFARALRTA